MATRPWPTLFSIVFVLISLESCLAQFGGSRAGAQHVSVPGQMLQPNTETVEEIESYIEVQGVAEVRVVPTELRLVLAIVREAETSSECRRLASQLVASLKADWEQLDVGADDMFEDFISILPVYRHEERKQQDLTVLQEVLDKYRYQTNLHVKLKDNEQARNAINIAFARNVTNIVAFDYWHPNLDAIKTEALQKAVLAARRKADILLAGELFQERPQLMNIREDSQTLFPSKLYHTFQNVVEQSVSLPYRQNIPRISAPRPKTTYYRGPVVEGDAMSSELPMKPEISVISRVRLFFASPLADEEEDDED